MSRTGSARTSRWDVQSGPDADLEALLTDDDLVPASATKTATDKD